ncbi:MAG: PilZ domain-containing protein [Proteobacteria bacterium]|nr:PilZ domain-containing protein [Pseudomonadota bacterium]
MAKESSVLRKDKRRHLHYYAKVLNRDNGEIVGRAADISMTGLMIVRVDSIETGKTYALRLLLPEVIEKSASIDFEAVSRWSKKEFNPDFHVIGFETTHIDSTNEKMIIQLIKACGFDD